MGLEVGFPSFALYVIIPCRSLLRTWWDDLCCIHFFVYLSLCTLFFFFITNFLHFFRVCFFSPLYPLSQYSYSFKILWFFLILSPYLNCLNIGVSFHVLVCGAPFFFFLFMMPYFPKSLFLGFICFSLLCFSCLILSGSFTLALFLFPPFLRPLLGSFSAFPLLITCSLPDVSWLLLMVFLLMPPLACCLLDFL